MSCQHQWEASISAQQIFCSACGVNQADVVMPRLGRYPPLPEQAPSKPVVVPAAIPNIQDLAGGLRRVADAIERGEYPEARFGIWVLAGINGKAQAGVFGPDVDRYRALGILEAARQDLLP